MSYIKIVFSDIDGTLLNKERELSAATKLEMMRLAEREIPFILTSARMPKAMRHLLEECGLNYPLVAYNGALVLSARGTDGKERVIFSQTIPFAVLLAVAAFWTDSSIHVSVFRNDEWFTEDDDEWKTREERNTKVSANILPLPTLVEMWQIRTMGPHKIMCMGDAEELTILHVLLEQRFKHDISCHRPKDTYLEITPAGVSKATAAELLLMDYGWDFRVTAAFGDHYNDAALLEAAMHGVAMGNAPEAVRKSARHVAPANTEDGVAAMLRKLVP